MKKTYSEMTVNQLRHIASVTEKKIKATMKSIQTKGLYSPALRVYRDERIAKPISKMNRSELYNTIYRQNDLKYKQTGTVKGTYEYINDTRKTLLKDFDIKAKNRDVSKLFEVYDDIAKKDPSVKAYKYKTLEEINSRIKKGAEIEDLLENAEDIKTKSYERKEKNGFEDFTEL